MKSKKPREKGKLEFSRYFQDLKEGDKVSVAREPSCTANFPDNIQGRVGTVEGKKGKVCIIRMKDLNKEKTYLIQPIHLKKINQSPHQNDKK